MEALKKNCASNANRGEHDDGNYGYKYTALSPERPHRPSPPLSANGKTNVEELQRPFLRQTDIRNGFANSDVARSRRVARRRRARH
jgi:hypothetical protein